MGYAAQLAELKKGVRQLERRIGTNRKINRAHAATGFRTLGGTYEMLPSNVKLQIHRNAVAALKQRHEKLKHPRQGLFGHKLTPREHANVAKAQTNIAILNAKIRNWELARAYWQQTRQANRNHA